MATIPAKHFDVLDFVKQSKALGVDERVAELQARQIEQAIDIAVTAVREEIQAKELATKGDMELAKMELKKDIAQASNKTILWVVGILGTFSVFFLSVLARGFHWF